MSVRHTILGLLAQRPRHGYELHAAFQAIMGDAMKWDVKPGQVYATLARLEEAGAIVPAPDEGDGHEQDRRVYAITDKGLDELRQWFATPVPSVHQRSEFFAKLMLAIVTSEASPQNTIQVQRAHLFKELHAAVMERNASDPQSELAHILLLDSTVMHLEADLRWLDMVEARLAEIRRQPPPAPEI